jgi:cysteine sulfinate desulfinase/cysteine desulfurase-like protein
VQASLRFSLGRGTTGEHVDRAAALVAEAVDKQRKTSRSYAGKA